MFRVADQVAIEELGEKYGRACNFAGRRKSNGLLVNLGSVGHSLAYWERRFGGGREEMNLFREHDICRVQR